jgi:hypothetical protein
LRLNLPYPTQWRFGPQAKAIRFAIRRDCQFPTPGARELLLCGIILAGFAGRDDCAAKNCQKLVLAQYLHLKEVFLGAEMNVIKDEETPTSANIGITYRFLS